MSSTPQPGKPPMLDGVGITPEPEPEVVVSPAVPTEPQPADAAETAEFTVSEPIDRDVQRIFFRAYVLISAALLVSAVVASRISIVTEDLVSLQANSQLLFFFEIACVAALIRYVPRLPRDMAAFLLFFSAIFNGISFVYFLIWFPPLAVAYGFLVCSLAFGLSAAISKWRGIDLSSWRGILLLFGAGLGLVATLSLVLRLELIFWETSLAGFMIFGALASYYNDDIRNLDLEFEDDPSGWKAAVCGALIIYLNFVNLYLIALRAVQVVNNNNDSRKTRRRLF